MTEQPGIAGTGLSEEDETTLYGPLPADFWGEQQEPSNAERASTPAAPPRPSTVDPVEHQAADSPPETETPDAAAVGTGTAFAELQELFPGRILEVIKDRAATEQPPALEEEDQAANLEDDEGYDDPDQSRLSFGLDN